MRTIAVTGALLLATSVSAKTVTITLVANDAPEIRPGTYERTIKAFEAEHPSIRVKYSMHLQGDFVSWLLTTAAAGAMPDVFYHRSQYTDLFASRGLIKSLDSYIKKDKLDMSDFWASQLPELTYKGRMYVLPEGYTSWGVTYNVEQAREAGLIIPNKPWSWDDLRAAALKLTKRDGNKTSRYGFQYQIWGAWGMLGLFYGKSGAVYSPDLKACTIGDLGNVKLLEMLGQMGDQGVVPPFGAGDFAGKKVSMSFDGAWVTDYWRKGLKGNHFDIAYAPTGDFTQKPSVGNTGAGYVVAGASKHPQEAWELVKYLTSEKIIETEYVANLINVPGRKSGARVFAQKVGATGDPKNVQIWVDSAEKGWTIPTTPYHADLVTALADKMGYFYRKTKSASWVMQEVEKAVNLAMKRKPMK